MQKRLNTTQVFLNDILSKNDSLIDIAFYINIDRSLLTKMIDGEVEANDKEFRSILTWWIYYMHNGWPAYKSAIEVCEAIKGAAHA